MYDTTIIARGSTAVCFMHLVSPGALGKWHHGYRVLVVRERCMKTSSSPGKTSTVNVANGSHVYGVWGRNEGVARAQQHRLSLWHTAHEMHCMLSHRISPPGYLTAATAYNASHDGSPRHSLHSVWWQHYSMTQGVTRRPDCVHCSTRDTSALPPPRPTTLQSPFPTHPPTFIHMRPTLKPLHTNPQPYPTHPTACPRVPAPH